MKKISLLFVVLFVVACGSSRVKTTLETPGPVLETITVSTTETTRPGRTDTTETTSVELSQAMAEFKLKEKKLDILANESAVETLVRQCDAWNPPTYCRRTRYGMYTDAPSRRGRVAYVDGYREPRTRRCSNCSGQPQGEPRTVVTLAPTPVVSGYVPPAN